MSNNAERGILALNCPPECQLVMLQHHQCNRLFLLITIMHCYIHQPAYHCTETISVSGTTVTLHFALQNGMTLLHMAAYTENLAMVRILISNGASLEAQSVVSAYTSCTQRCSFVCKKCRTLYTA